MSLLLLLAAPEVLAVFPPGALALRPAILGLGPDSDCDLFILNIIFLIFDSGLGFSLVLVLEATEDPPGPVVSLVLVEAFVPLASDVPVFKLEVGAESPFALGTDPAAPLIPPDPVMAVDGGGVAPEAIPLRRSSENGLEDDRLICPWRDKEE